MRISVEIRIKHINNTPQTERQNSDLWHSTSAFTEEILYATQQQNIYWDEMNPTFIRFWKLASLGGRNKSFEYDARRVLMFISVLSLRMEGGIERGRWGQREGGVHCAADRIGFVCDEWGCHRRWQVCVQYMWMYNTLCIPWQAGSFFVPMISKSLHLWLLMVDTVAEGCPH